MAGDRDPGVLGREDGRVLHQLGDEVDEVVDDRSDDRDIALHAQADSLVLLDLRQRGPHDVDERDGLVPPPHLLLTAEHQQVFGVAPHAGGQVVQLEQARQPLFVLLALFEVLDQPKLPFDERLAAPGQVDEHRVDVAAQQRFVGREPYGLTMHLVKGPRDLTDFVGGVDVDRGDMDAGSGRTSDWATTRVMPSTRTMPTHSSVASITAARRASFLSLPLRSTTSAMTRCSAVRILLIAAVL